MRRLLSADRALTCRTADKRSVSVRGRPAGGHLVVFLEADARAVVQALDFGAALDAMPVPAWIRGKDLAKVLRYQNPYPERQRAESTKRLPFQRAASN